MMTCNKGEGKPEYIGRIVEYFKAANNKFYSTQQWFSKAEDTVIKDQSNLHDTRRVFLSNLKDVNLLDCIISKINILRVSPNVIKDQSNLHDTRHVFLSNIKDVNFIISKNSIVRVSPNVDLDTKEKTIPRCDFHYNTEKKESRITNNKFYFTAQWFFKAEDTVIKDQSNFYDTRRVFLSNLKDVNLLDLIISKISILRVFPNVIKDQSNFYDTRRVFLSNLKDVNLLDHIISKISIVRVFSKCGSRYKGEDNPKMIRCTPPNILLLRTYQLVSFKGLFHIHKNNTDTETNLHLSFFTENKNIAGIDNESALHDHRFNKAQPSFSLAHNAESDIWRGQFASGRYWYINKFIWTDWVARIEDRFELAIQLEAELDLKPARNFEARRILVNILVLVLRRKHPTRDTVQGSLSRSPSQRSPSARLRLHAAASLSFPLTIAAPPSLPPSYPRFVAVSGHLHPFLLQTNPSFFHLSLSPPHFPLQAPSQVENDQFA
ncbi:hypothetical protein MRB53_006020 [Persea americana]|uniref:Uncharacterized protein n=1 Tax=Persea americana TaxID=3435 RepID=A0ACC2MEY9_PERAE|nr:hypothetical protein MRB53_006020 [Persea americana]